MGQQIRRCLIGEQALELKENHDCIEDTGEENIGQANADQKEML